MIEADFGRNRSRPNGLSAYCRACGNSYQSSWAQQHAEAVRQSTRAWEQTHREQSLAYQRDYYQRHPEKQRADNLKSAAQRRQAFVAPVDDQALFEQCGWVCQLCHLPVDPTLRWPDPMSATLDHIIPIARGGTHQPNNAQLAHAICNIHKRDQLPE